MKRYVNFCKTPTDYPTLNTKRGERAMLVKNSKGDWGLVTGFWEGYKNVAKGNKDVLYN